MKFIQYQITCSNETPYEDIVTWDNATEDEIWEHIEDEVWSFLRYGNSFWDVEVKIVER